MTTLRSQIAAARALADDWAIADGDIRNEVESLCDRLERACELLRDALWNLREADRAHLAEPISAFLAGEAK